MIKIFKSCFVRLRHYALALGFSLVGFTALAEETAGSGASDPNMKVITDCVSTWLGNVLGSFRSYFVDNHTIIFASLSIALGIVLLWEIFRWVRFSGVFKK